ncbi:DEAD/DEAH box helicase, partial [Candidatus Magnetobacterium casense]
DFAFYFTYSPETLEYCRELKKTYGNRQMGFIADKKCWGFNNAIIGVRLKDRFPEIIMDENSTIALAKARGEKILEERMRDRAEQLKNSPDSNIKIPGLKMDLYPYQKVGVEFFVNNRGRAILADTMGLGKTAMALAYCVYEKLNQILVICPASVKYSWENEVKKWTKLTPLVITSDMDDSDISASTAQVFIINYDILKKFSCLRRLRWDCLICDEFHYIKNSSAIRTKLTKAIAQPIPRLLLLSGTPLLSRPIELFNGLNLMDGFTWHNWFEFTTRYCAGHFGRFGYDARGASRVDELRERIKHYFLRRCKEDVLPDLPPKRFIDLPVELSEKSREEYDMAQNDFVEYLRDKKKKRDPEIAKVLQAEVLVKLNALRLITSAGKVEYAVELINNIIDGGEKVIVFSVYNEPLDYLKECFGDQAVLLTGKTPIEERPKIIDAFQKNPKIKIFLGGTKSAGIGITLTAASSVVFLDYSWVPADHAQAADRAHRIGQKAESVTIYQLYARDTIDHYMRDLLAKKQKIFDKIVEGQATEQERHTIIADLTSLMEKRYEKNA